MDWVHYETFFVHLEIENLVTQMVKEKHFHLLVLANVDEIMAEPIYDNDANDFNDVFADDDYDANRKSILVMEQKPQNMNWLILKWVSWIFSYCFGNQPKNEKRLRSIVSIKNNSFRFYSEVVSIVIFLIKFLLFNLY